MKVYGMVLFAGLLLTGCGGKEKSTSEGTGDKVDYSTPRATMESFIAACKVKDAKAVAACFSPNCSDDFRETQQEREPDIEELFAAMATAKVKGDAKIEGDKASLEATYTKEGQTETRTIQFVKETHGWKIYDF